MDVRDICHQLFDCYGKNPEVLKCYKPLSIGKSIAKIHGHWLLLMEYDDYTTLSLWHMREESICDSGFSLFRLYCGARSAGVWAAVGGDLMKDTVQFNVMANIELPSDTALIIILLISSAARLACSDSIELSRYWTQDKIGKLFNR